MDTRTTKRKQQKSVNARNQKNRRVTGDTEANGLREKAVTNNQPPPPSLSKSRNNVNHSHSALNNNEKAAAENSRTNEDTDSLSIMPIPKQPSKLRRSNSVKVNNDKTGKVRPSIEGKQPVVISDDNAKMPSTSSREQPKAISNSIAEQGSQHTDSKEEINVDAASIEMAAANTKEVCISSQNQASALKNATISAEALMGLCGQNTKLLGSMLERVESMEKKMQLFRQNTTLLGNILERLDGMEKRLEQHTNGPQTKPAASSSSIGTKRNFKQHYDIVMQNRLTLLQLLFQPMHFIPSVCNVVFYKIAKMAAANELSLPDFHSFLNTMMGTVNYKEEETLAKLQSSELAERCLVHRAIILDILKKAQANFFNVYSDNREERRPPRPFWLRKSTIDDSTDSGEYMREGTMLPGFTRREKTATKGDKTLKRRNAIGMGRIQPTIEDDGEFVAYYLYGEIFKHFNASRRSAITLITEEVLYLLLDWTDVIEEEKLSKKYLKIEWVSGTLRTPLPLHKLPFATVNYQSEAAADQENKSKYSSIVESRKELQLLIQSNVLISEHSRARHGRRRQGKDMKQYCRIISLLDVAGHFVSGLCGYTRNTSLVKSLKYSKYSIIALYLTALNLRKILEVQTIVQIEMAENALDDTRRYMTRRPPTVEERKQVQDILDSLRPNKQQRQRSILRAVTAVSKNEFDVRNNPNEKNAESVVTSNAEISSTDVVQEDIDFGGTAAGAEAGDGRTCKSNTMRRTSAAAIADCDEDRYEAGDDVISGSPVEYDDEVQVLSQIPVPNSIEDTEKSYDDEDFENA